MLSAMRKVAALMTVSRERYAALIDDDFNADDYCDY